MPRLRGYDWKAMGDAVVARRSELGWKQKDLHERVVPVLGIETLRRVEAGDQQNYRPTTLAAVSTALGWPAGMLQRIALGEAAPVDPERLDLVEQSLRRVEERLAALERDLLRALPGRALQP